MRRLRRFKATLLTVTAALVAGCGTWGDASKPNEGSRVTTDQPRPAPPGPYAPGPEGSPLPPRDPRIAERWPPEIKQVIDNMLTLFPRSPNERSPGVAEVARKMNITLTEVPLVEAVELRNLSRRYAISGTRYVDPVSERRGLGEYYVIRKAGEGRLSQLLKLMLGPASSGYCIDPYEFAIYTGSKFSNADNSPHATIRYWAPAYVWGMFRWSRTGKYFGEGFTVDVGQDRDPVTYAVLSDGCVASLGVVGRYEGEER